MEWEGVFLMNNRWRRIVKLIEPRAKRTILVLSNASYVLDTMDMTKRELDEVNNTADYALKELKHDLAIIYKVLPLDILEKPSYVSKHIWLVEFILLVQYWGVEYE